MATVSKHGKGWRAQIRRLGYKPISKTFPLKGQAWAWAERVERELLSGHYNPSRNTFGQALERYARNESPKKRGARWEKLRLAAIGLGQIAQRPLERLTAADLSAWRDERLQVVSGATVRREMNLLQSVLEISRREWKWIATNPMLDVQKPRSPRARRRRVRADEITAIDAQAVSYAEREVAAGFRLGIETAMRAGEMWSLERPQVDLRTRVAHLTKTKNGDERDVALSPAAVRIIRGLMADGRQTLFTITNGSRDALFRDMRARAGIEDLHFHDSRAEAIWRLSKRLDVLELSRQTGHRDIRSLMFYYQADAAELARKLARRGAST